MLIDDTTVDLKQSDFESGKTEAEEYEERAAKQKRYLDWIGLDILQWSYRQQQAGKSRF